MGSGLSGKWLWAHDLREISLAERLDDILVGLFARVLDTLLMTLICCSCLNLLGNWGNLNFSQYLNKTCCHPQLIPILTHLISLT